MDPMFPSQGNPPAPMLQDLRGSAKRVINYFWIKPGELALDGQAGRVFAEMIGTATGDVGSVRNNPLSYDVIGAETPDVFAEDETPDWMGVMGSAAEMYGMFLDPNSATSIDGWGRFSVVR